MQDDKLYAKTESGLLVPKEITQQREVWTYDDGRKVKRFIERTAKDHQLGFAVLCLKCLQAGRPAATEWSRDPLLDYAVLSCACTKRLLQEQF